MRRRSVPIPILLLSAVLALTVSLSGCATTAPVEKKGGAEAKAPAPAHGKVEVPKEFEVTLNLTAGQSWKSRFVSTSEVTQSLKEDDGKGPSKRRIVGLELVATQRVTDVRDKAARIEVHEISTRILQDGKFVDAPFRQFNPPNPVSFSLDTETGKIDFSELEKAYSAWMEGVRTGPAGEIFGKSFRLDAYVTQLKELYGKPFNRFARKTLSREPRESAEKEFLIPFLGPGTAMGPIPVAVTLRTDGFEVKGGVHAMAVSGQFFGEGAMTPEELEARLAELGSPGARAASSSRSAKGTFRSLVDVLSGREIQATSQVTYAATAAVNGKTFSEEMSAKLILEPAD